MKRTARGFTIYAELADSYGADVSVVESSAAERQCVWIFTDGGAVQGNHGSLHLTRKQATKVRDALNAWLKDTKKTRGRE